MMWMDKWAAQLAQLTPEQRTLLSNHELYLELERRALDKGYNIDFVLYVKFLALCKRILRGTL